MEWRAGNRETRYGGQLIGYQLIGYNNRRKRRARGPGRQDSKFGVQAGRAQKNSDKWLTHLQAVEVGFNFLAGPLGFCRKKQAKAVGGLFRQGGNREVGEEAGSGRFFKQGIASQHALFHTESLCVHQCNTTSRLHALCQNLRYGYMVTNLHVGTTVGNNGQAVGNNGVTNMEVSNHVT